MTCAIRKVWLPGALSAAILLAGCATRDSQAIEATRAVNSMQATRAELVRAQSQADEVLAAMNRLTAVPPEKLKSAFETFTNQVSQTVNQEQTARRRAEQMRERWREYIASWEEEIDQLTTAELREKAAERRQAVRKNYGRLRDAARATDDAYLPFLRHLQDIQRSLSIDLTPAGVKAAQSAFERARQSSADLRKQIGDFIAEIDQVMAISPPAR